MLMAVIVGHLGRNPLDALVFGLHAGLAGSAWGTVAAQELPIRAEDRVCQFLVNKRAPSLSWRPVPPHLRQRRCE